MAFVSGVPLGLGSTPRHNSARCHIRPTACTSPGTTQLAASLTTLKAAIAGYVGRGSGRPGSSEVASALESAAKGANRKDLDCDILRSRRWRLVFTGSQRGFFRDLYFPFHVAASWTADRYINTVLFGPCKFELSGPSRWVPPRLEFTFCDAEIGIGSFQKQFHDLDPAGSTLEGRTAKELPFFTFLYADDQLAIARGRSGGLAVWASIE